MGPLQMLLAQMSGAQQPVFGHQGGESAPMGLARSKIAQMFGGMLPPGMQDEAQMSAPRMEAQRRIDHMFGGLSGGQGGIDPQQVAADRIKRMFSGLPQTPEGIRSAIGADRY